MQIIIISYIYALNQISLENQLFEIVIIKHFLVTKHFYLVKPIKCGGKNSKILRFIELFYISSRPKINYWENKSELIIIKILDQ